jgi:hypothetical protein
MQTVALGMESCQVVAVIRALCEKLTEGHPTLHVHYRDGLIPSRWGSWEPDDIVVEKPYEKIAETIDIKGVHESLHYLWRPVAMVD